MVKKQKQLRTILIFSLIMIGCLGASLFFIMEEASNKLIKIMVDLNSYVDDSVYFSYHRGFGYGEYSFFIERLDEFFKTEHLIEVLESSGIYDINRLERFRSPENADIALVELRKIQIALGKFLLKQRTISILIIILSTGILVVLSIGLMVSFLTKSSSMKYEIYRSFLQKNLLDSMEKERNLVAFELHDDLAQKLALINRFFLNPDLKEENLAVLKRYSEETIQQVRLVSNRLKTPGFNNMSLKDSFFQLFSEYKILTGINLEFKIIGFTTLNLSDDMAVYVYRTVQELLNNALKHSEADRVSLTLIYGHPDLIIRYKDNGIGFDLDLVEAGGSGLDSIKFRMELLRAVWKISSSPGKGVICNIRIPLI